MSKEDKDVLFIRGVPPEVKTAFKAACARKQESMTTAVIRFLRTYTSDRSTANLGKK